MDCPICFRSKEDLVYRRLPCHASHVFCSVCLLKVYKTRAYNFKNGFPCPLCKTFTKWDENGIESFEIVKKKLTPEEILKKDLKKSLEGTKISISKENRRITDEATTILQIIDKKSVNIRENIDSFYYDKQMALLNLLEEIDTINENNLQSKEKIRTMINLHEKLLKISQAKVTSSLMVGLSINSLLTYKD